MVVSQDGILLRVQEELRPATHTVSQNLLRLLTTPDVTVDENQMSSVHGVRMASKG